VLPIDIINKKSKSNQHYNIINNQDNVHQSVFIDNGVFVLLIPQIIYESVLILTML